MKPFLREVAEDLVARLGEDLQHSAIIFNNKRPIVYLQSHLARVIGKPFWSPSFYTIQEFFALSSDLKVADPFTQFFSLFKQFNAQLQQDGEMPIEPAVFYPVARIILGDFSQIDSDLVDPDRLFAQLQDFAEIDYQFDYLSEEQQAFLTAFWKSYSEGEQKKQQEQFIRMWRRMPGLYTGFHQELQEKGLSTTGMIYRRLAEGKAGKMDFDQPFSRGRLVFVGFNALSRSEAAVFRRWQEEGKALFYFDTDDYYMDDPIQEAGLFLRKNLKSGGLINALEGPRSYIRSRQKTINVYQAQGQTAQAKILQQTLEQDYPLLDGPDNAGKIALILADEHLLLPVLQTIPSHYDLGDARKDIEVNVTMGYPLGSSSVFGLADLWLSIQVQLIREGKHSVSYKEVESFLSHPLTGISEKMAAKIQERLLTEQLVEVPLDRLRAQKGIFDLFFCPVKSSGQATTALQDIFRLVLERQLEAKRLKQTEADLLVAAIKELNRLHDGLVQYLPRLTSERELSFVFSLLQKAIQGISVPLTGEPLQGIQVMGLLESRSLDFEQVYVLGVNEGILPQTSIAPSFIPYSIRKAFGLPVLENLDAISAYMFYRLLQRSNKVSLVYNAQADESNTGEPSRFIRQLEYESGFSIQYVPQRQQISTEDRLSVRVEKDDKVMAVLQKYLNGETALSASALTAYINCPLQFFYRYIAKIEEPEEISENLEANYIGSMLHYVLEQFYRRFKGADPLVTQEKIAAYRGQVQQLAVEAFSMVMFKNPRVQVSHSGMQKVVLAIVEEYANLILDFDEQEAPFEILDLEKRDRVKFTFELKGQMKEVMLYGIIDRIDRKNGITRIVDYKTGSDNLRYSNLEDVFDTHGNKQNKALIQTLFYTYVFEQANAHSLVEPNLYSTRNMRNEGTFFMEGKDRVRLKGEKLESIKEEFVQFMQVKLAELFDERIPFTPTENEDGFLFSPYLTLCGR